MQSTAAGVALFRELTAGVEGGEDDLESGLFDLLMDVDGDAATVVLDRDRGSILM